MQLHRASISLNNIGISLLERRAYRQAVATFKDSLLAMRQAIDSAELLRDAVSIESKIHQAAERLAKPLEDSSFPCVQFICLDDTFIHSIWKDAGVKNPSAVFPIRLGSSDAQDPECLTTRDIDFKAAAILYNFALAYYCLFQASSNRSDAAQVSLKTHEIHLLDMAFMVLCNSCKDLGDTLTIFDGRLALSVVILRCIVRTRMELGLVRQASLYYEKLLGIEKFLLQLDKELLGERGMSVAAAA